MPLKVAGIWAGEERLMGIVSSTTPDVSEASVPSVIKPGRLPALMALDLPPKEKTWGRCA